MVYVLIDTVRRNKGISEPFLVNLLTLNLLFYPLDSVFMSNKKGGQDPDVSTNINKDHRVEVMMKFFNISWMKVNVKTIGTIYLAVEKYTIFNSEIIGQYFSKISSQKLNKISYQSYYFSQSFRKVF